MVDLSTSDIIAIGSAVISLVSVGIVIKQYQDSQKPAITTWIAPDRFVGGVWDGPDYLNVKNVSLNSAEKLRVKISFIENKQHIKFNHEFIEEYLNPGETIRFLVPIREFHVKQDKLFKQIKISEDEVRKVPLKDLELRIKVDVSCSYGVLPRWNSVSFKDDFRLDWRTPEPPDINGFPNIFVYHERNGHPVENSEEMKFAL